MANTPHQALSTVEAYHRAWTSGDVDRALTYVAEDVRCFAPGENVTSKDDWRTYLTEFVPMLPGAPEHTQMTAGDQVALWYFPQTAVRHDAGERAVHCPRRADRRDPARLRPLGYVPHGQQPA